MTETLQGHTPDDDYVVECFWPGVTVVALDELDRRVRWTTRVLRGRGVAVRYLGSILVPSDEVALFEFRAGSREAVADASARAGIPFHRIVAAVRRASQA
jgi:hypothetical protein